MYVAHCFSDFAHIEYTHWIRNYMYNNAMHVWEYKYFEDKVMIKKKCLFAIAYSGV